MVPSEEHDAFPTCQANTDRYEPHCCSDKRPPLHFFFFLKKEISINHQSNILLLFSKIDTHRKKSKGWAILEWSGLQAWQVMHWANWWTEITAMKRLNQIFPGSKITLLPQRWKEWAGSEERERAELLDGYCNIWCDRRQPQSKFKTLSAETRQILRKKVEMQSKARAIGIPEPEV